MMKANTWKCSNCHIDISQLIYPCPFCPKQNKPAIKQSIKKQPLKRCHICTFQNQEYINQCQMCQTPFQLKSEAIQLKPSPLSFKKSVITCENCKQQNDLGNQTCAYCEEDLFDQPKINCDICGQNIKSNLFDDHYNGCLLSNAKIQEEKQAELKYQQQMIRQLQEQQNSINNFQQCIHCRMKFSQQQMPIHQIGCKQKGLVSLYIDQKTRMTKLQIQAITYMHSKAEKEHIAIRPKLQQRIKKLGYSIEDLNNLQFYVQNYAPIIIHIHVSKHLEFFIKDTHYRSQFETNKSSGSLSRTSRIQWQDRMFDKKYSIAKDFQRVKYGVINFTNDPKGVTSCASYGQSYFLLKQHVRERCTFTDKDSSNSDAVIATFKYCFPILNKMNDGQLKAAFTASKAQQVNSSCTTAYKQIQIHGPIEFNKDIERIYVNRNEVKDNKKLLDMMYDFSKKNKIDHDFF